MTNQEIKKVAVIGAGVMGAGIAAQAANSGAQVLLLDVPPRDLVDSADQEARNSIAQGAVDRFIKAGSSGGLMHPSVADRIEVGNTEDDFGKLADCDWIVEVIIEDLAIKQDLYKRIEAVRAPHAIVSSNTSTIPLAKLVEGLPGAFCQHFVVTHFFNPPRYMRLVEIVSGEQTLPDVQQRITRFNDIQMGKTVIQCKDRPGFIANRLGVYWMQVALQEAIALGLTVEEADQVMQLCGFPKTGIFGLWDLCGIDLMPKVTASLASLLSDADDFAHYAETVPVIQGMVEKGYFGRKGRVLQGFYRQHKNEAGEKIREVLDLDTLEYRAPLKSNLAVGSVKTGDINGLLNCTVSSSTSASVSASASISTEATGAGEAGEQQNSSDLDKGAVYAWKVLSRMLHYASQLVPEVAEDTQSVDSAMKLGYNWRFGPFELIQRIGVENFCQRLQADGVYPTEFLSRLDQASQAAKPEGVLHLSDLSEDALVQRFSRCALWRMPSLASPSDSSSASSSVNKDKDSGSESSASEKSEVSEITESNVWCLQLTDRVNPLNSALLNELEQALQLAIQHNKALVIYSDSNIFAAGADLKEFLELTEQNDGIDGFVRRGQQVFQAIEQAPVPVVAAVAGKALGGGLELVLHCHAVQAYAETQVGLVENLVGIVPGWGGCKQLLARSAQRFGAENAVEHSFNLIRGAKVTASALEAQQLAIFHETDAITMNHDRLLFDAVSQAERLWQSYQTEHHSSELNQSQPELVAQDIPVSTEGYQGELESALLNLLNQAAKPDWYQNFYDWERECNLALVQNPKAKARIEHFLATGKPLSN